jgi:ABC-2 type transport system permease protein
VSELAIPRPAPSRRLALRLALRDTGGVAKRNLLRIARTPMLLVVSAVQPALLLILFRYVLGGAIRIPGGSYVN